MLPIYLDYQATTPTDPRVVASMQPYWTQEFGNPHSEGHSYGWKSRQGVEYARKQVANFIGADDDEIVFTSGATESCNIALRGIAAASPPNGRRQVITLATEHSAVLETVRWLGRNGCHATVLPVKPDGLVDLQELRASLSDHTLLVSAMLVNNEIGVIQPLAEISRICQAAGTFVHTDATQAAGRIKVNVDELGIDLLSLSAHKLYGPNGIGVLYVRNRPGLQLAPITTGGAQERGIRPGTVPAPLAVGMGKACAIAGEQLDDDARRLSQLGERLLQELVADFPNLRIFGNRRQRVPGNLSLGFPGIPGELLVESVSGAVAISTGAACATGSPEPSHVLMALGVDPETAATGVRISLGRFTTDDEISAASIHLRRALRTLSGGTLDHGCATIRNG